MAFYAKVSLIDNFFILFPGQEYRDVLFRINQLIVHPVAIHEKVIFLEK